MYYPYEYLWYHDLRRWTYAEDDHLIYLRTRHYDVRFNTTWRDVKLFNLNWWQDIANDAVFRRRNKDVYDCYDRFCKLVDKFMELRVMDRKERPYWEHYKMLRWFFHDCRNKFPDN
ncbi:Protein of unknown function [Cotesia congregata]|uniref:Uncharacterized protein n=1 Tax=Cotesia congregata TaxID=51543 RepID=A0A8J2ML50_COTCN|nr:Protein of unknown function [Cotesia congregata]